MKIIEKSKELTKVIYDICKEIPSEKYIIIPQITRAVISIGSNVVEGQQRSDKDFIRFLTISRGSLYEVKYQLEIINEIYNVDKEKIKKGFNLIDEIGKMTYSLITKIKNEIQ